MYVCCLTTCDSTILKLFEKSLYDLIRGLRNNKGNEGEYVQRSLKECRAEVRSQDMDVKATALLKLIYLEMLGHDMSWASFHVLEVMSSPKYHQKRVGYLGAVQSFRPDTEVLMLATNLLKKDLASSSPIVISLPVVALPHLITPSLALSTLADLLPRLSHSQADIRKKTLVTLFRLALVYPEALRAAWPRIKERLMDPDEDPSVTAAIVNVVCELGWRRPHDFLPLAPRLFELLVDGGNNWMAIKIIKLFATLTPLEPRLVKKLLPPLTNIMSTTSAMSLLYECINGIIQGGILGSVDEASGSDEIATLCVSKLRGMIMIDGDPNLKYVALLAFNKIVVTHPWLVAQQEDVILDCIDSPDITIRIQALELVQGMVTSENLSSVVGRLLKQLQLASPSRDRSREEPGGPLIPGADSDDEAPHTATDQRVNAVTMSLPDQYRADVVSRILFMCSKDNYSGVLDFDWYVGVLTRLIRLAPLPRAHHDGDIESDLAASPRAATDVSVKIGDELRNVAVKVRAMRSTTVSAAETILAQIASDTPPGHAITSGALRSVTWVMGEYASHLSNPEASLDGLIQVASRTDRPEVCATALFAVVKIFASVAGDETSSWTAGRKSRTSLLLARILHLAEALSLHPNLEIQERAVEFVELLKLTAEAASGLPPSADPAQQAPPLLLTQAIPSLFQGWELNSVAPAAQRNVPLPEGLDLDEPIHANLNQLLSRADMMVLEADEADAFDAYYNQRPPPTSISSSGPAIARLADPMEPGMGSYQQSEDDNYAGGEIVAKRRAERLERNKDDPFYIANSYSPRSSTQIHSILHNSNGPDLDIDSIPILELDLRKLGPSSAAMPRQKSKVRQKVVIAADETLDGSDSGSGRRPDSDSSTIEGRGGPKGRKPKKALLQVDSSIIGSLSLDEEGPARGFDHDRQQREEVEMQTAMKEVERLRLEMQRANERVQAPLGVDMEGVVVKKKEKGTKKKKKKKEKMGGETESRLDQDEAQPMTGPAKAKKRKGKASTGRDQTQTISTMDEPPGGTSLGV